MKRASVVVCVIASVLLLTGCGIKKYKTVEDYKKAMFAVQNLQRGFTYEVSAEMSGEVNSNLYYKTIVKDNKWKTGLSMNGGSSYYNGMIYDGKDLIQYSAKSPYAMKNPAMDIMKDYSSDSDEVRSMFATIAPSLQLLYWDCNLYGISMQDAKFVDNKAKMNGYKCRLIKFGDVAEACVSDELGMAVYYKTSITDEKLSQTAILNLVKFNKDEVTDADLALPAGVKLMDLDQMMQELSNSLKSMSKMNF